MDETVEVPDPSPMPQDERPSKGTVDWLFRNRQTGEITIAQFPNVALWIFIVTFGLRWVVPVGTSARAVVDWIGVAALAWWALDEVIRGVNPWRRLMGIAGCVFVVTGIMTLLR